jgi:hypothetical protein
MLTMKTTHRSQVRNRSAVGNWIAGLSCYTLALKLSIFYLCLETLSDNKFICSALIWSNTFQDIIAFHLWHGYC